MLVMLQPAHDRIQRLLGSPSGGSFKQGRWQFAAQFGEEGLVVEMVARHCHRVLLNIEQRFERRFQLTAAGKDMPQTGNAAQRIRCAVALLADDQRFAQHPFGGGQVVHRQVSISETIEVGGHPPRPICVGIWLTIWAAPISY